MDVLRQLLFERQRITKVLDFIRKGGIPNPKSDPDRALVYAHALIGYGDTRQAEQVLSALPSLPLDSVYEAERHLGLGVSFFRLSDPSRAKGHLEEALALNPPLPLRLRIYNVLVGVHTHEGLLEDAYALIEKGIVESLSEPHQVARWMLEGNRGVLLLNQGRYEEALLVSQRAVKQCELLDAAASAAHNLITLSAVFENLGDVQEYGRCLERAEKHFRESGSVSRLIYLRYSQGTYYGEYLGLSDKAEQCFQEAFELLREFPVPELEIPLSLTLARFRFKQGRIPEAFQLVQSARNLVQRNGFPLHLDGCLFNEAVFLLRSGSVRNGLENLKKAEEAARTYGNQGLDSQIALYFAFGYEEVKDRPRALDWLKKCFEAAGRTKTTRALMTDKEVLVPLLLKHGDDLPLTDSLSQLLIQLRHPALLKRLLKRGHEGKTLFLRSLQVHDARHFRKELARLKDDPEKEVRRTARLALNGWHRQTGYRIYTLGPLRPLFEGKLVSDRDWRLPIVKRLFLFFLTDPDKWQKRETILEALWEASPRRGERSLETSFYYLRTVFEPWHLPGIDYLFFQSRRGSYGFFPGERFWRDDREFEKGIKKAEKDQLARNFKEARRAYREALDLYLGDYLEEFPYEDWLRPKRDYLRELYFRGVMRYAALEKDSGNLPEARRVLEEALFKDMSRCDCITLLIQTLARMKLTQQAKDWGERHITYMKKELKEKPAPEVKEALARL